MENVEVHFVGRAFGVHVVDVEFNIDLRMDIKQQLKQKGKELRVGRCDITFHCTPKAMMRERASRRKSE